MGLLDKIIGGQSSGVENMNEPPSSQGNTSIAKITALAVLFLPVLYMGLLYLANFLPEADAARVKNMIDGLMPTLIAAGGGGGTLALFLRSLMLTQGKIKNQTPAMPEQVTAGGDVNLNQSSTPQPALNVPQAYTFGGTVPNSFSTNDGTIGELELPVIMPNDSDAVIVESLPTFDEIANR